MKRFITSLAIACTVLCASSSCEDFLDVKLSGVIDGDYAMSHPEEMCIAAYSALGDDYWDCRSTSGPTATSARTTPTRAA